MVSTHLSLLNQAREGNDHAWQRLEEVYGPLIQWWLRKQNVQAQDAEEIGQEVLIVVLKKLDDFQHSGNVGAFRCWLRRITANQIKSHARKHYGNIVATDASFESNVESLQDDQSDQSQQWDRQHNQFLVRSLLTWIQKSTDPTTVNVFEQLVLNEVPAEDVAKKMGMTVGAIYSAKSRVLRKIRQAGADLIDELWLT